MALSSLMINISRICFIFLFTAHAQCDEITELVINILNTKIKSGKENSE